MKKSPDQNSTSLRASLNLFMGVALAGALSMGAISFWGSYKSSAATVQTSVAKDLLADLLPPPMYLIEMRLMLSQLSEGYLASSEARERFERLKKDFNDRSAHWGVNAPEVLKGGLLRQQAESARMFMDACEKVMQLQGEGANPEAITAAIREANKMYLLHRASVDKTVIDVSAFAKASHDNYTQSMALTRQLEAAGMVLVSLAILGLGFRIRRAIWSAVGGEPAHAANVAFAVAKGDLTTPIQIDAADRYSIMSNLKAMQSQLMQTVRNVRDNAERVSVASAEIAAANQDLSTRTETQAASIEETVTSIQRLSEAVRQNAESARHASSKAHNASSIAVQGGEVVSEVVHTMRGINEASHKISEIISVIDGIAFQTNILALNAAVEAARAGDQGRGFAVVASEVRSLAGRSAEAAKEISQLINASVQKVEQGTVLVDRAGVTMGEVVQSIRSVTDIIGAISIASDQQAEGVTRVGQAISIMDQGTQQTAAQMEQMAAATQSLKSQSKDLVATVAQFTLDGHAVPRLSA